jgi:ATPase subunit of ABC transporter with duplicated ATPase domains
MITVTELGKSYGAQTLFCDASLRLAAAHRYGVVGANGAGKSTFLRLLSGEEEASAGAIQLPRRARVGVLRQDHFRYEQVPIVDVVMMGNDELWEAMVAKEALLSDAEGSFDVDRYGELEEVVLRHDGYAMEARAGEILEGLNIPAELHREPLSVLSGGYKLRVLMAQTLAAAPDVLLLDEPTNHLDIVSIRWLEKFLASFKGCVVTVSHDHRFLNNVCTDIIDVDYERLTLYRGNYDDFVKAKHAERERKEREIEQREQEIAHHKAMIDRFRAKPTKARQAQSKAKLVERITIEELPRTSRRYPRFRFAQRRPSGKDVLTLESIAKSYDGRPVLEDVSLTVQRGDRLAVIGPNGIGKSTLLRIMLGRLPADRGEVRWGYETHPGYFAQDHRELLGEGRDTIESWLWDYCPGENLGFIRAQLAAVLFGKDEVSKKISNLSGGEAARLVFAQLGLAGPNVLVLDEPTNHLDLEGIEALVAALECYEGTIVFVSHDRWFVSRLATRILELRADGIEDFRGSYEDYVACCGDDHLDADVALRAARRGA